MKTEGVLMATTKIWPVKGSVGHVLRYIQNENKTDRSKQSNDLDSVLHYIGKGERIPICKKGL